MLLHHIERLLDAGSPADIRSGLFRALDDYGYPSGVYIAAFYADFPAAVIREAPLVLGNLPADLLKEIDERFGFAQLPWVDWARRNRGAITLARLTSEASDEPGANLAFEIVNSFGLASSRIISLTGRVARAKGMIMLCPAPGTSTDMEEILWLKGHRDLLVICHIAHMQIAHLANNEARFALTPRQREVLEWTSAGKTVAEIATILGLTSATVEKHLRLARDTLGAASTSQAILKAYVAGQIFRSDEGSGPLKSG